MQDTALSSFVLLLWRRRAYFLITAAIVFAIACVLAMRFSSYRATVTVQIEQPAISSSVTDSSTGPQNPQGELADRRIRQIEQRVTSIESLNALITKLNLYPELKERLTPSQLAAIMRSKIQLNLISSAVANPAAISKESVEQLSAIAFTLSYNYNDPELTQQAVDAIVARFIEEEAKQRQSQSQETVAFLDSEMEALEADIASQEKSIAEFKAKFGESGPSAILFNQQASMNNTLTLQNIESQISTNAATIGTLRGQLATTDPYSTTVEDGKVMNSPMGQLKALQAEYASLTGRYGPEHPDVRKVQAQIAALKAEHPKSSGSALKRDADNPLYLQLSAQLSAAQAQQGGLMAQREALKAQQMKYEAFLAENPRVEQQMSQLSLDLDNAKTRYRDLKTKKTAAEMKSKLEQGNHGERLTILQPSSLPTNTTPKRSLLIVVGLMLSMMSGLIAVGLAELLRQTVRDAHHLTNLLGVAPLVTIPHIHTQHR